MPLFRKKPVIIEAARTSVLRVVHTLEGTMQAQVGDWIIKGVKGEVYPCKDNIFRETYEPVDEEGAAMLAAPDPDESDDQNCIIPFPGAAHAATANSPLDTIVTDA